MICICYTGGTSGLPAVVQRAANQEAGRYSLSSHVHVHVHVHVHMHVHVHVHVPDRPVVAPEVHVRVHMHLGRPF